MKVSIEKTDGGSVVFSYGEAPNVATLSISNPTNVITKKVTRATSGRPVSKVDKILISFEDGRGSQEITYADLGTINGAAKPANIDLAIALIVKEVFSSGGGSGEGAVESVTGNLVNGSDPANPTIDLPDWVELLRDDRVGYLNSNSGMSFTLSRTSDAVKFLSPVPLTELNLKYPTLTDKIKKVALIFNCDVDLINNTPLTNAILRNIPTKAKQYDCWTLMYDSGDRTWDFISVNSVPKWYVDEAVGEIGTDRQISGFPDGKRGPVTLEWKHLSDQPFPPDFNNGVVTIAKIPESDKSEIGMFRIGVNDTTFESEVIPNSAAVYNPGIIGTGGGTIPVADAINDEDAVNLGQINDRVPAPPQTGNYTLKSVAGVVSWVEDTP